MGAMGETVMATWHGKGIVNTGTVTRTITGSTTATVAEVGMKIEIVEDVQRRAARWHCCSHPGAAGAVGASARPRSLMPGAPGFLPTRLSRGAHPTGSAPHVPHPGLAPLVRGPGGTNRTVGF